MVGTSGARLPRGRVKPQGQSTAFAESGDDYLGAELDLMLTFKKCLDFDLFLCYPKVFI